MSHSIPTAALSHLEPRPGGQWLVAAHAENSFLVSYVLEDGTSMQFTMRRHTALKDVTTHCDPLIYKFTGGKFAFDFG